MLPVSFSISFLLYSVNIAHLKRTTELSFSYKVTCNNVLLVYTFSLY